MGINPLISTPLQQRLTSMAFPSVSTQAHCRRATGNHSEGKNTSLHSPSTCELDSTSMPTVRLAPMRAPHSTSDPTPPTSTRFQSQCGDVQHSTITSVDDPVRLVTSRDHTDGNLSTPCHLPRRRSYDYSQFEKGKSWES